MSRSLTTLPPRPPNKFWWLEITTQDPSQLLLVRNIIHSYLTNDLWSRCRMKKGTHRFKLRSIDDVIDRSIRLTIEEELEYGTTIIWGTENDV